MKRIYLFVILLLFTECSDPISEKGIKYISIDVTELKNLILNDTTHYKVLFFYSTACGCCHKHFSLFYSNALKNFNKDVKIYFLPESKVNNFYNDKLFLKDKHIYNGTIYYLKDTNECYDINNKRTINIINNIFNSKTHIESLGLPTSVIVSKSNIIKIRECHFLNDSIIRFVPCQIHELKNFNLNNLNFNKIEDTILEIDHIYIK